MKAFKEIEEKLERQERYLEGYKKLRPYLIRLFTHIVILYLIIRGYYEYLDSNDSYSDFVDEMNKPLITDIKVINSTLSCDSLGEDYEDIDYGVFPAFERGCQCDEKAFKFSQCQYIVKASENGLTEEEDFQKNNTWLESCINLTQTQGVGPVYSTSQARLMQTQPGGTTTQQQPGTTTTQQQPGDTTQQQPGDNTQQQPGDTTQQQPGTTTTQQQPGDTTQQQPGDNTQQRPGDTTQQQPGDNTQQQPGDNTQQQPGDNTQQQPGDNTQQQPGDNTQQQPGDNTQQQPGDNTQQQPGDNTQQQPGDNTQQQPGDNTQQQPGDTTQQQPPKTFLESANFSNTNPNYYVIQDYKNNSDFAVQNSDKVENGDIEISEFELNLPYGELPSRCSCYRDIDAVESKNLTLWFKDRRICMKKDQSWTTKTYLSSVRSYQTCKSRNRCQIFFCKEENQTCPIFDIWAEVNYKDDTKPKSLNFTSNQSRYDLFGSDYYNEIVIPITGITLGLEGRCSNDEKSFTFNHNLLTKSECSSSQVTENIDQEDLKIILNNNNRLFLNYSQEIPLFEYTYERFPDRFALQAIFAFYPKTISCLMKQTDIIEELENTSLHSFRPTNKFISRLLNILYSFITIDEVFRFQNGIQIFLLSINCFITFIGVLIIIVNIIFLFVKVSQKKTIEKIIFFEVYFSFCIDLITAIVAGVTYFYLSNVLSITSEMITKKCSDDFLNSKYGIYMNSVEDTAGKNLEIFLILLLKLFLIFISIVYYLIAKECSMDCNTLCIIIYDNLNEGGEHLEVHEEKEMKTKKSYLRKNLNVGDIINKKNIDKVDEDKNKEIEDKDIYKDEKDAVQSSKPEGNENIAMNGDPKSDEELKLREANKNKNSNS